MEPTIQELTDICMNIIKDTENKVLDNDRKQVISMGRNGLLTIYNKWLEKFNVSNKDILIKDAEEFLPYCEYTLVGMNIIVGNERMNMSFVEYIETLRKIYKLDLEHCIN